MGLGANGPCSEGDRGASDPWVFAILRGAARLLASLIVTIQKTGYQILGMGTSDPRGAVPLPTMVNLALTAVAIVVIVIFFALPARSPNESLDTPAAVVAWAYLILTPILALIARLAYPEARRRLTYGTFLLWAAVVVLAAITCI